MGSNGFKKNGDWDLRTKAGREMKAQSEEGCRMLLTLPFRLLFFIVKWTIIIVFWPISLIVWLIRRNRD